jgi:hypothetical protein
MTQPPNRTPSEWFQLTTRWYVEGHQGCICCGSQHCVFRSEWGQRVEYYCSVCDFSTCHDLKTGHYYATVGDGHGLLGMVLELEPL